MKAQIDIPLRYRERSYLPVPEVTRIMLLQQCLYPANIVLLCTPGGLDQRVRLRGRKQQRQRQQYQRRHDQNHGQCKQPQWQTSP